MDDLKEKDQVESPPSFPRPLLHKLLIAAMILLFINYLLMRQLGPSPDRPIKNLDGTIATYEEIRSTVIPFLFIILPIISLILGFFVSLFPYKKLIYWKKYLPASLTTLIGINSIIFLTIIIRMIVQFFY